MEVNVLPLTYFGNISYFRYLYGLQAVWIDDHEPYLKQTFRNRTQILAANGKLDLTVPVNSTKGKELPFNLIEINYNDPWQVKHTRTIRSAYKSAPFFEEYENDILSLINEKHTHLADLNKSILHKMMEILNKEATIHFSSVDTIPLKSISLLGHFKPSKMPESHLNLKSYVQVFNYKFGFVPNLSILDLLFNEGPYALGFLLHKPE